MGGLLFRERALIAWLSGLVCIIHTMNSADLIKQLLAEGWVLRAAKGSHHIYTHPDKPGHLSVPHPKKDLGVGLCHKLMKQAGLKPRSAP